MYTKKKSLKMMVGNISSSVDEYKALFVEETSFYNRIFLGSILPPILWENLPHFFQTWLRNYIGGSLLYLGSGFLWCFVIYYWKRNLYIPKGNSFSLIKNFFYGIPIFFCFRLIQNNPLWYHDKFVIRFHLKINW